MSLTPGSEFIYLKKKLDKRNFVPISSITTKLKSHTRKDFMHREMDSVSRVKNDVSAFRTSKEKA